MVSSKIINFFKFRMYKASWLILIGFIILAIVDFISTFRVGELVEYMETNPLFMVGGWLPVFLMNIIAVYILLRAYGNNSSIINNWSALTAFFWISIIRIGVIISNFKVGDKVISGEITKTMVMNTPPEVKLNLAMTTAVSIILPMTISLIIFWVFSWDFKIDRKVET